MRLLSMMLIFLASMLLSACDFWPRELTPLADSITRQVSGETTVWLVGGDVLIINVAGSPLYRESTPSELEALVTDIAGEAVAFTETPLESIAITFHEGEISDDPEKMREFIFLVMENRPVLQPEIDMDASGPLTLDEIQAAIDHAGESISGKTRECVLAEAKQRAEVMGDPETLDPSSVELLSNVRPETWHALDAFSRRIFIVQAITTEALFACASMHTTGRRPDLPTHGRNANAILSGSQQRG